jgi:hypothetical protein
MIDAFCRATGVPFAQALRQNRFGIERIPLEFLPTEPLRTVTARHTVGMIDPLTDDEITPTERVNDGLPQSLQQCIRTYGLTHFKIKLSGDIQSDLQRLRKLAAIISDSKSPEGSAPRTAPSSSQSPVPSPQSSPAITLDGNENFRDIAPFRRLWNSLIADETVRPLLSNLMFVEQPLHRDVALSDAVGKELRAWTDRPPIIIDESDATLESLPAAINCGYAGTSHKNCKGIFKGIANACRIGQLRQQRPDQNWILSGEDLSVVGPISLLQDLAVMATLGIHSVERNGHHYFRGLSTLPKNLQQTVLSHHGDIYRRHDLDFPTLNVRNGIIHVDSAVDAPFGEAFDFDPSQFTPLKQWTFESTQPT